MTDWEINKETELFLLHIEGEATKKWKRRAQVIILKSECSEDSMVDMMSELAAEMDAETRKTIPKNASELWRMMADVFCDEVDWDFVAGKILSEADE